jgi:trehalose 6-phosphate phosphatase
MFVPGFDSKLCCTLFPQVHEFVGIADLYYAGSHGMDIIGPLRQSVSDNHPNCIRSTDKKVLVSV